MANPLLTGKGSNTSPAPTLSLTATPTLNLENAQRLGLGSVTLPGTPDPSYKASYDAIHPPVPPSAPAPVTPPVAPTKLPSGPISSKTLTPTTPMQVTQPAPATGSSSLGGYLASTAKTSEDTYIADQKTAADAAKTKADTSFESLYNLINNSTGKTGFEDSAYKAGGVDEKKAAARDINNKIIAEQEAQRHAEEQIKKTPGISAGAMQQMLQDSRDKAIQRQAALAVTKLALDADYQGAKEIADRAAAAAVEQQQKQIDAAQLTYERNQDLFTTAEKRAFEAKQKERQDALDMKREEELYKYKKIIDEQYHKNSGGGGATATQTKAQEADDVAQAVVDFQNQIHAKGWAGANPDAYNYYRTELSNTYGASAALALDKAMLDAGITVDYTNN